MSGYGIRAQRFSFLCALPEFGEGIPDDHRYDMTAQQGNPFAYIGMIDELFHLRDFGQVFLFHEDIVAYKEDRFNAEKPPGEITLYHQPDTEGDGDDANHDEKNDGPLFTHQFDESLDFPRFPHFFRFGKGYRDHADAPEKNDNTDDQ